MTERLYYTNPGLLEFEATVVEVGEESGRHLTVLDRSAFYPTSGGQLFDTGFLGGVPVIDVDEGPAEEVRHWTASPVGTPGERVAGMVDAYRRRMHRQQHTAQHILSQTFVRLFGYETVSVHLGEEYGAIELNVEKISEEQLREAEERAVEAVFGDLPVEILFAERTEALKLPLRKVPKREGVIRIIKIDGFDHSACGGTHCDRTGQVGLLKIVGVEKMRGHALVNFLAGEQARADFAVRYAVTSQLTRKLTCSVNDLVGSFDRIEAENKELKREMGRLQRDMMPSHARELAAGAIAVGERLLVVAPVDTYDSKLINQLAGMVAEQVNGVAALLFDGRLIVAVGPQSGLHAGNLVKELSAQTGLRGGGNQAVAQVGGADPAQLETYRAILETLVRAI